MRRLAASSCPPGGFWAKTQKITKNSAKARENPCNHIMARHILSYTLQNTQSSSPYLKFTLQLVL